MVFGEGPAIAGSRSHRLIAIVAPQNFFAVARGPKISFHFELAVPNDWRQQISSSDLVRVSRFVFRAGTVLQIIRIGTLFHFVFFFWAFITPYHGVEFSESVCPFRQSHFCAPAVDYAPMPIILASTCGSVPSPSPMQSFPPPKGVFHGIYSEQSTASMHCKSVGPFEPTLGEGRHWRIAMVTFGVRGTITRLRRPASCSMASAVLN